jgi:hypothetical protein
MLYFVPGGRIGFRRPASLIPAGASWRLASADGTFITKITETLRLGEATDSYLWDKDERSARISSDLSLPGFEHRLFRDLRYGPSDDYADISLVVRDDCWMGQLSLATHSHGGRVLVPEGQIARWQQTLSEILESVAIRDPLPPEAALAEFGIRIDLEGLHPRLAGDKLIMSLSKPSSPAEAWGTGISKITICKLAELWTDSSGKEEAAAGKAIKRMVRGDGELLAPGHCRGVKRPERESSVPVHPVFSTRIHAFGRVRSLDIDAGYGAHDREPMLRALDRVFRSLAFTGGDPFRWTPSE